MMLRDEFCPSHCEISLTGSSPSNEYVFSELWFGAVGRHRVNKDVGKNG